MRSKTCNGYRLSIVVLRLGFATIFVVTLQVLRTLWFLSWSTMVLAIRPRLGGGINWPCKSCVRRDPFILLSHLQNDFLFALVMRNFFKLHKIDPPFSPAQEIFSFLVLLSSSCLRWMRRRRKSQCRFRKHRRRSTER